MSSGNSQRRLSNRLSRRYLGLLPKLLMRGTLLIGCLICLPRIAGAQGGSELAATYGRGVHAYFAGNTAKADQLFSDVISAGSKDPRVFYFRAMTRLRSGSQYEAEDDMRIGAALEALNPGRRSEIGRSLQRIQGSNRRTLEQFRREARLLRVQELRDRTQKRYEQLRSRGPTVLHQANPVPLEQLVEPSVKLPAENPALSQSAEESVLGGETGTPVLVPDEPSIPAQPEPATASSAQQETSEDNGLDDLFGEPAQPVTEPESEPAGSDLFGEPEPASQPTPGPAPVPADHDDLFGPAVTAPAEEEASSNSVQPEVSAEQDVFGAEESAGPAPENSSPSGDASQTPPPAEEDDIFGALAEPSPSQAPSAEAPAGQASATDADDDPFAPTNNGAPQPEPAGDSTGVEPAGEEPIGEEPIGEEPSGFDDVFSTDSPTPEQGDAVEPETAEESPPADTGEPASTDAESSITEEDATVQDQGESSATDTDMFDLFGDSTSESQDSTDPPGDAGDTEAADNASDEDSMEEDTAGETEEGEPADNTTDADDPFGGF